MAGQLKVHGLSRTGGCLNTKAAKQIQAALKGNADVKLSTALQPILWPLKHTETWSCYKEYVQNQGLNWAFRRIPN